MPVVAEAWERVISGVSDFVCFERKMAGSHYACYKNVVKRSKVKVTHY